MTAPRNTVYLDAAFLEQETITELWDRSGPAGPLAFLALILESGKRALDGAEPPTVSMRYEALGALVGATAGEARSIVRIAADVGLVALEGDDDQRFRVRILERGVYAIPPSA